MTLRSTLLVAALALFAATAHAQLAAYGTLTVEHINDIKCTENICGTGDGTVNPIGGVGGVYYDFRNVGPVRLGVDVRAGSVIGNKNADIYFNTPRPRLFSVLGGVRASFKTPIRTVHPYVEGAVGLGRTEISVPLTSDGHVVYHSGVQFRGFAGVDLNLLPVMDFRVVELGAGAFQGLNSTFPLQSISTGLVFHLPF